MSTLVRDVKNLAAETRRIVETELDNAELYAGLSRAARDKGIDWTQLKKLVKAQAQDARDGTDKRTKAIIAKAEYAAAYADIMNGNVQDEPIREIRSSSVSIAAGTPEPAQKGADAIPPISSPRFGATAEPAWASRNDDLPDLPPCLDRRGAA